MKGAVSGMTCAGAYFAKDTNKDFPGEIYVRVLFMRSALKELLPEK